MITYGSGQMGQGGTEWYGLCSKPEPTGMAKGEGFEPRGYKPHRSSRAAPSTTRTPLREGSRIQGGSAAGLSFPTTPKVRQRGVSKPWSRIRQLGWQTPLPQPTKITATIYLTHRHAAKVEESTVARSRLFAGRRTRMVWGRRATPNRTRAGRKYREGARGRLS